MMHLVLTTALLLIAVHVDAQTSTQVIEQTALAHVRSDLPRGRIVIDDEVLAPNGSPFRKRTAAEQQSLAAVIPGGVVEAGKPHATCTDWKKSEGCKLDVDAVVSLARAKLLKDSATVMISVMTHPIGTWRGFTRVDYTVELVKRNSAWVVVRRWVSGQT